MAVLFYWATAFDFVDGHGQTMKSDRRGHVRFWHIADAPLALTNVCFGGKNGHDADLSVCPLMTQSGHCCPWATQVVFPDGLG
jgi:hypothetical protein